MNFSQFFRDQLHMYVYVRVYSYFNFVLQFLLGPDHVQLTLLNWDNESILASLNKKLKFPIHFQFFLVPKHFWCPNSVKSIADDPASNV